MKRFAGKARDLALLYLRWAWPLLLADAALEMWIGRPAAAWGSALNFAAFVWVLCAPVAPFTLLLDRPRRERAMARLCGVREGDERERAVTGEAARATLLLGLTVQAILLAMSLISVRLSWDPVVPEGEKHGLLSVGMAFSSERHLDPFGGGQEPEPSAALGRVSLPEDEVDVAGGFLLAPSTFPVLALLMLVQLAAFRCFALRRYEGFEP